MSHTTASLLAAFLILMLGVLSAPPTALAAGVERRIVCSGSLPFSEKEVREALLARWHLLGDVSVVQVRAEGERTMVQVGSVEREVDLQGHGGEEAARIVAVVALDLAQAATPFAVSTPPEVVADAPAGPAPAPSIARRHDFRAGVLILGPFDQSGLVAHLEPTLDAGWDAVPGFGAFLSAGYRQASSAEGGGSLTLREIPLRAGVALRRRWVEVRAGGTARPRFAEGPRSSRAVSWGGAVSVVARIALTSRLALVVAGGVDLFRTRLVFTLNSDTALTTPWLSPWVGAGIAWGTAP